MGLLDKVKNALFEVEYVEVEEPEKKERKFREKKEEKPIAKKIVLPGKKEEKIEKLEEEELKNENFEARPKNETIKESSHDDFKIMDDNDFKVDDDIVEEPKILRVLEEEDFSYHDMEDEKKEDIEVSNTRSERLEESYSSYSTPPSTKGSKAYGIDHSYEIDIHPYGTYETREEKTFFKPSPIISPIYGILDKNYKKEDVKEKRDIPISSSYSSKNITVDTVRNKAYGTNGEEEIKEDTEEDSGKFEVQEEDDKVLVDLSDRVKPEVKELTMGDAMEYFQDLGLEYNVDYVDVSKEKSLRKRKKEENEENEEPLRGKHVEEYLEKDRVEEKNANISNDEDNDNLFDLIDSMYEDKD